MSHSPGPWSKHRHRYLVDSNGTVLAEWMKATDDDERLIVASPRLLAAAERAMAYFDHEQHPCDMAVEAVKLLREAIKEAKGETAKEALDKFSQRLDEATKIVSTWPEWKQRLLGGEFSGTPTDPKGEG